MARKRSKWDREAIKAAVRRRGITLADLARQHGFHSSTCHQALMRPCFTGEQLIAHFLDLPAHEIWPDRYDADGNPLHPRAQQWQRSTGLGTQQPSRPAGVEPIRQDGRTLSDAVRRAARTSSR